MVSFSCETVKFCLVVFLHTSLEEQMILNILGGSGSGKTTLKSALLQMDSYIGFLSYTTRPMRQNESQGIHYHFISLKDYDNCAFAMKRYAHGWHYGVFGKDLERGRSDKILVTTFDQNGILEIEAMGFEVAVIYLDIPKNVRRKRMLQRGDALSDIKAKLELEITSLNKLLFKSPILRINNGTISQIVNLVDSFVKNKSIG